MLLIIFAFITGRLRTAYFFTKASNTRPVSDNFHYGRIGRDDLRAALDSLGHDARSEPKRSITAFLCGPPRMVDELSQLLLELVVAQDRIKSEKWW